MPKKKTELRVPFWLIDGFVGILALMIYNFLLYILKIIGVKGIIGQIEKAMGYFGMNSFTDLGFTLEAMTIGIVLVFGISFLIGIVMGYYVRKKHK